MHRSATKRKYCPGKTLVGRFIHLREHGAKESDIVSSYWDHIGEATVTDVDIRLALWIEVIKLHLAKHGIISSRVRSQYLQAGGAMALNTV